MQRWCPPKQYVGGIEHAILHLLYARFFTKALKDTQYINFDEPFEGLFCQGMVCHKTFKHKNVWLEPSEVILKGNKAFSKKDDLEVNIGRSEKMSKSKKNIVDPMTIINKYGADTARLFMLSDSPPERDLDWSESGVEGCWKFLKRIWMHFHNYKFDIEYLDLLKNAKGKNLSLRQNIHKSIKETTDSIEEFKYNSAVASIRKLSNILLAYKTKSDDNITEQIVLEGWKAFILMLAPMTPHIAEELWKILEKNTNISNVSWPKEDRNLLKNNIITLAIQINGKFKSTLDINQSDKDNKDMIVNTILNMDNIKKALKNNEPKKIISVPGKVVNIVI